MSLSTRSVGQCFLRGLWEMTLVLLLILALTASWTGRVQCEDEAETGTETLQDSSKDLTSTEGTSAGDGNEEDLGNQGDETGSGNIEIESQTVPDSGSERRADIEEFKDPEPTGDTNMDDLDPTIIIIPLVLSLVIIAVIVSGVIIYCRSRTKEAVTKEDPYLDNEDHEKVPMPMFEDDIPSVMELEMEDLENWMAKDGGMNVDTGQI